jgi:HD-GYP domain-containing protein (c-di-GMP phosphodiesterase class II)
MVSKAASELISNIMTAVSGCSLYSEKHPVVDEFSKKALDLIDSLYIDDSLSVVMLGDSLLFNDTPFTERGANIDAFTKKLRKKKIEKILIRKGVDIEEFKKFIRNMASRDAISSSTHISVGIVELRMKETGMDTGELLAGGIEKVQGVFQGVSKFKKIDMTGLEDAVVNFITVLKKESNILRVVNPVKAHSEYTYVHITNVSVLTLFQAEALGLKGEILHDIGIAGLLHDMGKLFVPASIIEKQGKLDPEEWTEMKKHPTYGALYLSKVPNAPRIASIAAFEHHMKFDGSGYPETKRSGRKQHIVSQMVSISDFFDALRTERSYRKSMDVPFIAKLLREGATEKAFNPVLVDSFLSALKKVTNSL